jgi:prepilin-type N-terminal cleavage/methylation domain-containing protein
MTKSPQRSEAGFTLVELLMAMVASSLLLILLGNVVAMLGQRLTHGSANQQQFALGQSANAFTVLVARTVPTNNPDYINISTQSITFPIQPSQSDNQQSALLVRFDVSRSANGNQLIASLVDPVSHQMVEGTQELLIANSRGALTLSAEEAVDAGPEFRLTLIKVNWADQQGRAHQWVAGPRINARIGCRFDPISLSCRP